MRKKRKANVKRRCQPCIICFNGLALLDLPRHWMKFHNAYQWLAFKLWWTHVDLIDKCFALNSSNFYIDIEFMFALHERKITIYRSIDLSSCQFICIMLVSSKRNSNLFISTFPTNQGKILLPMNKYETNRKCLSIKDGSLFIYIINKTYSLLIIAVVSTTFWPLCPWIWSSSVTC